MITERDHKIIRFIEEYRFSSIQNLEKIFFKDREYSYNIARRRLNEIRKAGYVKMYRDVETNKNIYLWNDPKIKPPSTHSRILINLLAEMHYNGLNVEIFKTEKHWMGGKIKSDAFTIFKIEGRRYHFFVEVHLSNNPSSLERYDDLYKTREVQEFLGKDFFPRVLLISDRNYNLSNLKYTKVVQLNTKLNPFASLLL